jgi:outer membrane protein
LALNAFAQNANGSVRPALPIPMSTSTLIGLEQPPQFVIPSKAALPNAPAPSNVTGNRTNNAQTQLVDLIQLYQEAAFSDPVLNARCVLQGREGQCILQGRLCITSKIQRRWNQKK